MLVLLMAFMAVVIAIAASSLIVRQLSAPYTTNRVGGSFAAVEMTGRPVTEKDFLGKPTVLFFGYTFCPDVCPTTLLTLSTVMGQMGRDADRLNVVFVTVDPQRDTPEQMKLYLSSFDPRIRGLTGTEAEMAAMANTFHIFHRRVPMGGGEYGIDHFAGVLLTDKTGTIVGQLAYEEAEASVLAKLTTLASPPACIPGAPPRVDLWSGARLRDACGSS